MNTNRLLQLDRSGPRQGFTIVELLVATTVTLLLIFAMAQAFSVVSVTIGVNRATLEMAGQLRGVAFRLQQDLEGHTAPMTPWLSSTSGEGYFEYIDGPSSDEDWNANAIADASETANSDTSVGDIDDALMFTSKSVEVPFVGQLGNLRIQSEFAEIAWWLSYENRDSDLVRDFDEPMTLHRRALLIRPDLNRPKPSGAQYAAAPDRYFLRLPTNPNLRYNTSNQVPDMANDVLDFYDTYDLSVHFARDDSSGSVALYAVANSLADLTLRHNRFCHDPVAYRRPPVTGTMTYVGRNNLANTFSPYESYHPFPVNVDYTTYHPNTNLGLVQGMVSLRNVIRDIDNINGGLHLRFGEDGVLANALSFDVQAYDINALVSAHPGVDGRWGVAFANDDNNGPADDFLEALWPGSDDEAVGPGDWGYGAAGSVQVAQTPTYPAAQYIQPCARGAYVDLSFNNKLLIAGYPSSYAAALFGTATTTKSGLYGPRNSAKSNLNDSGAWDTYPFDLENDGIDQDGDSSVDEGTNGKDDDLANGVDDDGEKETSPPYNSPMRGIRVRIRMIEPDTRQVRQSTVVTRFTLD